jgi:hypothetical protein
LKRRIDSNRTSSGSSGTSSGARPRELDDVGSYRSRTAASDVEDAAMLMGEAIGFALGYKIPAGEGHHWKAPTWSTISRSGSRLSLRPDKRRLSLR